jgi:hypothetical protein
MSKPPTYIAYLLRLWKVGSQLGTVWHASLEDPRTGERKGFADLKGLFMFLEEQTAIRARNTNDDVTRRDT